MFAMTENEWSYKSENYHNIKKKNMFELTIEIEGVCSGSFAHIDKPTEKKEQKLTIMSTFIGQLSGPTWKCLFVRACMHFVFLFYSLLILNRFLSHFE